MAENNNNSGEQNEQELTFDQILEDKVYQSEFDKRVSKALETAKAKWQTSADADKLKAVNDVTAALTATHAEETAKLNGQLKQALIQTELVKAKARDAEVVMPLIDEEKVTITDKGLEGLKEQLEALKTGKAYLFETDSEPGKPSGKSGLDHDDGGEMTDDAKIRKIMGLPPLK